MNIVLAGSVSFSRVTLERLLAHDANIVGVLGLAESKSAGVSDYARLDGLGVPYMDFESINATGVVEKVREWAPDVMFVVGLSQLVKAELLAIPRMGCIGFHPTHLPRGRGRAPVAWMVYDASPGAASFFLMDEGTDSGPLFVQEPFAIGETTTSEEAIVIVREAIARALDRWLPRLLGGEWNPEPQDESRASYLGKRSAEDGLIEWSHSAVEIDRLVRTAGRPYPGAYTYVGDARVLIWRTSIERNVPFRGVIGRVLKIEDDGALLVQTGDGLLWVHELEIASAETRPRIAVGTRLGYAAQDEIFALRRRVAALEKLLSSRGQ
ncbi:MAG TPA: methionyl-tRNA formyltransferase [Thermoanaerobaculia bacterium]